MFRRLPHSIVPAVLTPLIAIVLMLFSASAGAQEAAPQPSLLKAPPIWLGLLVMFLLLAVVVTVSLMPSKRSHQD